jgi:DNA polymerase elongation subunit (family B)
MDSPLTILAAELRPDNNIQLYSREGNQTSPFAPWLLLEAPDEVERGGLVDVKKVVNLKGAGEFRALVHFHSWDGFQEARGRLTSDGIPHFSFNNPVRQYLLLTGKSLFSNLRYEEVHRLQLDIETLTLDPRAPGAQIVLISLSDSRGYEEVLSGTDMSERALLGVLGRRIKERDPDVLEGHNIYDFDLLYIQARAERLEVKLPWGRDGSDLKTGHGLRRYRTVGRSPSFQPAYIHGRHIIDTYHQVQRFDIGGNLESYGLKPAIRALGLERENRVFVPGEEIAQVWRTDPSKLIQYALDDVRDVRMLSELVVPTEFYQTQLLPYTFQEAAVSGPGEKINALMVGAYLRRGLAIPRPHPARPFSGGYTELFASGIFDRVVKADVESLYPSIMLNHRIRPSMDTEDVFLPLLEKLTRQRLQSKNNERNAGSAPDRAYWKGLQNSYKILINSFYGYLGYSRASFNDFQSAEQVTTIGRKIARQLVGLLKDEQAEIIEADTDGVYFVAPARVGTEREEREFIESISEELPSGINLLHDGRYAAMISLKAKNYALMSYDGELTLKGSSLRNRRDESIFRTMIREITPLILDRKPEQASVLYLDISARIQNGQLLPNEMSRTETITEKTFSNPNLHRLAAAAAGCKIGDRISIYQKVDGTLSRIEHYDEDEDKEYLLKRLHSMVGRFTSLFDETQFRTLFPHIRMRAVEQLSLF